MNAEKFRELCIPDVLGRVLECVKACELHERPSEMGNDYWAMYHALEEICRVSKEQNVREIAANVIVRVRHDGD